MGQRGWRCGITSQSIQPNIFGCDSKLGAGEACNLTDIWTSEPPLPPPVLRRSSKIPICFFRRWIDFFNFPVKNLQSLWRRTWIHSGTILISNFLSIPIYVDQLESVSSMFQSFEWFNDLGSYMMPWELWIFIHPKMGNPKEGPPWIPPLEIYTLDLSISQEPRKPLTHTTSCKGIISSIYFSCCRNVL